MSQYQSTSCCTASSSGTFIFVQQKKSIDTERSGEKAAENYSEVFIRAKSAIPKDLTVYVITEKDALKISNRPSATVFVFSHFEGRAFEYLLKLNCCIVGPPLILACVRENRILPKSTEPRYSDIMKGIVVCCTGIEKNQRERIYRLTEYMNGTFTRDLDANCNVLLANDVTSKKYQISCEKNLLIVNSKWIFDIWRRTALDDPCLRENDGGFFDPRHPDYSGLFRLPVFHGLVITVSGLSMDDRQIAEKLIVENGGRYEKNLFSDDTTHLVSASTESVKYNAAVNWKIPTVNKQWITDSIESGYCKNLEHYLVDNKSNNETTAAKCNVLSRSKTDSQLPTTSTPIHSAPNFERLYSATDVKTNKISNPSDSTGVTESCYYSKNEEFGGLSKEKLISEMKFSDYVKRRKRQEHQRKPQQKQQCYPQKQRQSFANFDEAETKIQQMRRSGSSSSLHGSIMDTQKEQDASTSSNFPETPLQDLDLSITTSAQFLKGCRVFVLPDQFNVFESEKLKRMINIGSAKRCPVLDSAVSHVIAPEPRKTLRRLDENLLKNLLELSSLKTKNGGKTTTTRPGSGFYVVHARWLIHSFQRGKLMDEKNYQHPEFNRLLHIDDENVADNAEASTVGAVNSKTESPTPMKKFKSFDVGELEKTTKNIRLQRTDSSLPQFDEILSQYLDDDDQNLTEKNRTDVKKMENDKEDPSTAATIMIASQSQVEGITAKTDSTMIFDSSKQYPSNSSIKYIIFRKDSASKLNVTDSVSRPEIPAAPESTAVDGKSTTYSSSTVVSLKSTTNSVTTFKPAAAAATILSVLNPIFDEQQPVSDNDDSSHSHNGDDPVTANSTPATGKQPELMRLPSQSQSGYQIGWDDPCANRQNDHLATKLSLTKLPNEDEQISTKDYDPAKPFTSTTASNDQNQHYHFLITAFDTETKAKCISIIKSMGARVTDSVVFDPNCTHVICGKPFKNEKFLTSLATGKWILHVSYLIDSQKAGKFLQEDRYEWGSDFTSTFLCNLPDLVYKLALSCKRWRQTVERTNRKAFDKFRVLLLVDKDVEKSLRNVIQFGGGVVCDRKTPPSQITHVFYRESKNKDDHSGETLAELRRLKSAEVKCYKPEYLAAHLAYENVDEKICRL